MKLVCKRCGQSMGWSILDIDQKILDELYCYDCCVVLKTALQNNNNVQENEN